MIDLEEFKQEMFEWGFDFSIIQNDEDSITLELINVDPLEDFITIHEIIHAHEKNHVYEPTFKKMVVEWKKERP